MAVTTKQIRGGATGQSGAMVNVADEGGKERKGSGWIAWVNRVGRRNWIMIGALVLIAAAVWLNWAFFAGKTAPDGYTGYDASAGMTGEDGQNAGKTTTTDDFAAVQVSRKRARDESLEVLRNVLNNAEASESVKNEALAEMNTIAGEIEKEANIEALLLSKGFEKCVAVMNGNSINIVVKSAGELQPTQIAQINATVYEQTGIEPLNITIVHKN